MTLDQRVTHQVYHYILKTFAQTGQPPSLHDIASTFQLPNEVEAATYLAALEAKGCIYQDTATGNILAAYPFSATPTRHSVVFGDGRQVYAMCAVDALGIPFMLDTGVTIHSHCALCDEAVGVVVMNREVTNASDGLVVAYTPVNTSCCPATDQCPLINFFCSAIHAQSWQEQNPHLKMQLLTLTEAVQCSRRTFDHLLNPG